MRPILKGEMNKAQAQWVANSLGLSVVKCSEGYRVE